MKRKRSFTSATRFFASDELLGMENAIKAALEIIASRSDGTVAVNLFGGANISISAEGAPFDLDSDDDTGVRGWERIFNHPLDVGDRDNFGLVGEERLTLLQLVCDYMNVKSYDGEVEYSMRFEGGVAAEDEPRARYMKSEKQGNHVSWCFDSSLFIDSVSEIPLEFFKRTVRDFALEYSGRKFIFINQPDYGYSDIYTFLSPDGGESVLVTRKRQKNAI